MEIIERFTTAHNNKYDYSLVNYKNVRTKVDIICKKHGVFSQLPLHHIKGQGCKKCAQYSNTNEFLKKASEIHGDKYDYSLVKYIRSNLKVKIICKEHGEFEQTPNSHLTNHGCPSCGNTKKMNIDEFIDKSIKIHGNKYDYSLVIYKNIHKHIILVCKEHGEFEQTPNSHLSGSGCPICSIKYNKSENEWLDIMDISNKNRQIKIGNYTVDGYDPESNIIYEFYGDYWHGNPNIYNPNHINRNNKKSFGLLYTETIYRENTLRNMGYNVISIWENDFIKKYKQK